MGKIIKTEFDEFLLLDKTNNTVYLVGYQDIDGVKTEVRSKKIALVSIDGLGTIAASAIEDFLVSTVKITVVNVENAVDLKHTQNTDSTLKSPDGTKSANIDNAGVLHVEQISTVSDPVETHAEQVYTTMNQIILREGAVAGLAPGEYVGFKATLYDGTNNGYLVFDKDGFARVGDEGSLVKLAAIEETPSDGYIMKFNNTTKVLEGLEPNAFLFNKVIRTIGVAAYEVDLATGEDFTKTLGTASAFTIANPIIKKPFRLFLTGGTIASTMFTGYSSNWLYASLQADYVPANSNVLYCEIRSAGQIYLFWGE